jgi:hypothetical protein
MRLMMVSRSALSAHAKNGCLISKKALTRVNGGFALQREDQKQTAEICHGRSRLFAADVAVPNRLVTILSAEASADRDTHHSPWRLTSVGRHRGIRPIPYYPWRHLTLLINP